MLNYNIRYNFNYDVAYAKPQRNTYTNCSIRYSVNYVVAYAQLQRCIC